MKTLVGGIFFSLFVVVSSVFAEEPLEAFLGDFSAPAGNLFQFRLCPNTPDPEHWLGWRNNGGNSVFCRLDPERSLSGGMVFLYLEHIMSGREEDVWRQSFAPHQMPCHLASLSPQEATLTWKASEGKWPIDIAEKFSVGEKGIDLDVTITPRSDEWRNRYLAFMWANYFQKALGREIHFFGFDRRDLSFGWKEFGKTYFSPGVEDPYAPGNYSVEWGHIAAFGARGLSVDYGGDVEGYNLDENRRYRFALPVYYGFYDGDVPSDGKKKRVFVLMMSRAKDARFTLYNWASFENADTNNGRYLPEGTYQPAWDFQLVLNRPRKDKAYTFKVRLTCLDVEGLDDVAIRRQVLGEYSDFLSELGGKKFYRQVVELATRQTPRCCLEKAWDLLYFKALLAELGRY